MDLIINIQAIIPLLEKPILISINQTLKQKS